MFADIFCQYMSIYFFQRQHANKQQALRDSEKNVDFNVPYALNRRD
jgi:hypothetical protein